MVYLDLYENIAKHETCDCCQQRYLRVEDIRQVGDMFVHVYCVKYMKYNMLIPHELTRIYA